MFSWQSASGKAVRFLGRYAARKYERPEIARLAASWRERENAEFIVGVKQRSLLHEQTLSLLSFFAAEARHGILEIGTYIGGATVVMARAKRRGVPMAAIEPGGTTSYPFVPSADTLADFHQTLDAHGVAKALQLVEGFSGDAAVTKQIETFFGRRRIDLLMIDADGNVRRDFELYKSHLARGAVIVCDDYASEHALEKVALVQPWVDEMVNRGDLSDLGVYPWGTWFGQYWG